MRGDSISRSALAWSVASTFTPIGNDSPAIVCSSGSTIEECNDQNYPLRFDQSGKKPYHERDKAINTIQLFLGLS